MKKINKQSHPQEVIKLLAKFLADTFVLYIKTLNFHWNLVGPEFYMFHKLFEEHYEELAETNDELAERLRMMGVRPPSSMREYLDLATLKESTSRMSDIEMVLELVEDRQFLMQSAKKIIMTADKHKDPATSDLVVKILRDHDKAAWVLASHLEKH